MGRHVHNLIFFLLYHEAMKKGKTGTPCERGRALTPKVPRSNKVYTHRTTTTTQDGTVIVNKRGPTQKGVSYTVLYQEGDCTFPVKSLTRTFCGTLGGAQDLHVPGRIRRHRGQTGSSEIRAGLVRISSQSPRHTNPPRGPPVGPTRVTVSY